MSSKLGSLISLIFFSLGVFWVIRDIYHYLYGLLLKDRHLDNSGYWPLLKKLGEEKSKVMLVIVLFFKINCNYIYQVVNLLLEIKNFKCSFHLQVQNFFTNSYINN